MLRWGLAAALAALALPGSAGAAERVVEGESLRGTGTVVLRDALLIEPGGSASRAVHTAAVGSVAVRAERRGCGRRLRISADGRAPATVRLPRDVVPLTLTPGRHVLRVSAPARRPRHGCGIALDRLRLVAPPAGAPTPSPSAAPVAVPRVPLGTSIQLRYLRDNPVYEATLLGSFSSISAENELKMEWTQPEKNRWNFAAADALVDFAHAHGVAMRGHTLIFGAQTPPWVSRELLPGAIRTALEAQVRTVIGRYKERIREWDVVNEAIRDDGGYQRNPFYTAMGELYVDRAFEVARAVDPSARLYYNEINAEAAGVKRAAVVRLLERLRAKKLVDGVGLQMHVAVGHAPTKELLLQTLRLYEAMGLEVQITEMDVDVLSDQGARPLTDRLAEQAAIYRTAAEACAEVAACKRFTVWGVSDRYSWLGLDRQPLLLDAGFQPKPALAGVRAGLGM